jgi:hypothetical protein
MWTAVSRGSHDKESPCLVRNTLKPHGEGDILEILLLALTRDAPSRGVQDRSLILIIRTL